MSHRCGHCHRNPCRCHNHCNTDCGCKDQVPGFCVFYKGANLDCLGVTKGDNYDAILVLLDELICDLPTPSGTTYVGTEGQIDVTGNVISLSVDILTELTNINNDITTLQACCDDSVKNITSSTLLVTEPTQGNFVINYSPPAPMPTKDGIVYNSSTVNIIPIGGGVQIAEQFNRNYVTLNSLAVGDEIRFVIEGVPNSTATDADDFIFDIFNAGTAIVAGSWEFNNFVHNTQFSSFRLEGDIAVTSLSNLGLVSLKFFLNTQASAGQPTGGFNIAGAVYKNISTIFAPTWSNLTLRAKFRDNTASVTAKITKFTVEVRKKIL